MILSKFKSVSFDYVAFRQNQQIVGIMGQVGDFSGYGVDCIIACERKCLERFHVGNEFVFVGGSTLKKGTSIITFDLIFKVMSFI